jgi:hypothetical protein
MIKTKTETNAAAVVGAPVNLVPCPYCGQTHHLEIIKVQIVSGAKPDYAVKCEGCDAVGPWAISPRLAERCWNYRYDLSASLQATENLELEQPRFKARRNAKVSYKERASKRQ